jgi:hypothetical protein
MSLNTVDSAMSLKLSSLEVQYNLLCEKPEFYTSNMCESIDKIKKYKMYSLTHKVCECKETLENMIPRCWILEHRKNTGSNGGSTIANKWEIIPLNLLKLDSVTNYSDANVSLKNNTFKLTADNYKINIDVMFFRTGSSKIRLFNITHNVIIAESMAVYASPNHDSGNTSGSIETLLHLTEPMQLRIEYIVQHDRANYGLGLGTGFPSYETFAKVKITKYY